VDCIFEILTFDKSWKMLAYSFKAIKVLEVHEQLCIRLITMSSVTRCLIDILAAQAASHNVLANVELV
jgi:hypothetical protein